MTTSQQLSLWADSIRDMSATGLKHSKSTYDTDRYQALQTMSMQMMAAAGGLPDEALEPLRASLFSRHSPVCAGGGAVIDDDGRILLMQRSDNGTWAMPGGGLEVGETPAEGAVREVFEETGVVSKPTALVGIFDSRLCGTASLQHLYHVLFLCTPVAGQTSPRASKHANEVLDAAWFAESDLPNELCPGHDVRIPVAYSVWHGRTRAFFDGDA
jgi:ADP-ribose pyrophosphatase YjhB (NUDIX family)